MMSFRNQYLYQVSLSPKVVRLIGRVHDYKGKEGLYVKQKPDILESLRKTALIQSTESSNRIEGIVVTSHRLKKLMELSVEPQDRSEAELAGYRDVLALIHSSHENIPLTTSVILQFHRDLMKLWSDSGGRWKTSDNVIEEVYPDGQRLVRFQPVASWQTPDAVEELVSSTKRLSDSSDIEELLIIAAFALDFLCIHPFSDGNGRMTRLLTLLLLYHFGYQVGRYVSLEKVIEDTKDRYYETLYASSQGWHDGHHDIRPWLEYFFTVLLRAYERFEQRLGDTELSSRKHGWKQAQAEGVISHMIADFTIADIEERCPGVSRATIRKVLAHLQESGTLECIERGRNAKYRVRHS
jgi:Fic family protein